MLPDHIATPRDPRFARVLWTRLREYPSSSAISRMERPCARRRPILAASTETRGLPSVFPLALALRRPARTRSAIKLRSSSATAPKTVNTIFPVGVVVSICSLRLTNAMPSALKGFERPQQVGDGSSKAVKAPDGYHIKAPLVRVGHEAIQFRPGVFRTAHSVVDVRAYHLPAACLGELLQAPASVAFTSWP